MAKKKGICKNIDGECTLCQNKVIQERDSLDFVCEECGFKLTPYEEPKSKKKEGNKKLLIVCGVSMAVVVASLIGLKCCGDDEDVIVDQTAISVPSEGATPAKTEPETTTTPMPIVVLSSHDLTIRVGDVKQLNPSVENGNGMPLLWKSSNPSVAEVSETGFVKAVSEGDAFVFVGVQNSQAKDSCKVIVEVSVEETPVEDTPVAPSNSEIKLSYGSYKGDIKDGYADGMGRLVYSKSRVISKYDLKNRVAAKGDYVIGEFVRGFLVAGKLYSSSGQLKESLMIGVPTDGVYEQK